MVTGLIFHQLSDRASRPFLSNSALGSSKMHLEAAQEKAVNPKNLGKNCSSYANILTKVSEQHTHSKKQAKQGHFTILFLGIPWSWCASYNKNTKSVCRHGQDVFGGVHPEATSKVLKTFFSIVCNLSEYNLTKQRWVIQVQACWCSDQFGIQNLRKMLSFEDSSIE